MKMRSLVNLRSTATALAGFCLVVTSGCQPLTMRQRFSNFFGSPARDQDEDDWDAPGRRYRDREEQNESDGETGLSPKSVESATSKPNSAKTNSAKPNGLWWQQRKNSSNASVPRVILPKDRAKIEEREDSKGLVSDVGSSSKTIGPANDAGLASVGSKKSDNDAKSNAGEATVALYGSNEKSGPGQVVSAKASASSDTETVKVSLAGGDGTSIADTGIHDVDIDGALASLPPQFRDVVKKTITAARDKESSSPSSNGAKDSNAVASVAPDEPVIRRLSEPEITPPSSNETTLVANANGSVIEKASAAAANPSSSNNAVVTASGNVAANVRMLPPASVAPTNAQQHLPLPNSTSPAAASSVPPSSPSQLSAVTSPVSSSPITWHQATSQAIELLEKQLEEKAPADDYLRMSQEITLRMLYVTQRRLDDALRPIDRLSEQEQEYVRHQMQAMYEASNPDANPARSRHWSLVMNSQREATAHLASISNLEVRSVAFCKQVDGYGVMERFPKYQFAPDQDVLLYCEVDNVAAERVKGGYETQWLCNYEICDSKGNRITEQLLPMEP
ncbi:MAG: hypothetical protein FJ308_12370, partial [Planctomycetes bacterium]|nr:hypothetical protein [Planctomycetota bacterium]